MSITATATPAKALLSPTNHALVLIDFQSQMAFATKSIPTELLRNNAALVSRAAAGFQIPTILTTVAEKSFPGRCSTRSPRLSRASRCSTAPR
jgi:nicotinamidase-related amidase